MHCHYFKRIYHTEENCGERVAGQRQKDLVNINATDGQETLSVQIPSSQTHNLKIVDYKTYNGIRPSITLRRHCLYFTSLIRKSPSIIRVSQDIQRGYLKIETQGGGITLCFRVNRKLVAVYDLQNFMKRRRRSSNKFVNVYPTDVVLNFTHSAKPSDQLWFSPMCKNASDKNIKNGYYINKSHNKKPATPL